MPSRIENHRQHIMAAETGCPSHTIALNAVQILEYYYESTLPGFVLSTLIAKLRGLAIKKFLPKRESAVHNDHSQAKSEVSGVSPTGIERNPT